MADQLVKRKTAIPPSTLGIESIDTRKTGIFFLLKHHDPPFGVCYPAIRNHTVALR
jgi:hypothetical protein